MEFSRFVCQGHLKTHHIFIYKKVFLAFQKMKNVTFTKSLIKYETYNITEIEKKIFDKNLTCNFVFEQLFDEFKDFKFKMVMESCDCVQYL